MERESRGLWLRLGRLPHPGRGETEGCSVVAEAVERALSATRRDRRYPVGADARLILGVSRIPEPLRDKVIYRLFGLGPGGE